MENSTKIWLKHHMRCDANMVFNKEDKTGIYFKPYYYDYDSNRWYPMDSLERFGSWEEVEKYYCTF